MTWWFSRSCGSYGAQTRRFQGGIARRPP